MSDEKINYTKESLLISIKELEQELYDLNNGKSRSNLEGDWGPRADLLKETLERRKKQLNELDSKSQ